MNGLIVELNIRYNINYIGGNNMNTEIKVESKMLLQSNNKKIRNVMKKIEKQRALSENDIAHTDHTDYSDDYAISLY